MRTIPLDELPLAGAAYLEPTATGFVLRRLPPWTKVQIVDPAVDFVVSMPAGVRVELQTDARELELDAMLTTFHLVGMDVTDSIFDLVIDGVFHSSVAADNRTIIHIDPQTAAMNVDVGEQATIRFDNLPSDPAAILEVWFPHANVVELRAARVSDHATVRPATRCRRRWVHHGSSISHCAETPHPTDTWPAIAATLADVDLTHLGFAGQCHLDQYVARTIRDLDADLISVKAGINVINDDTMRERTFRSALHGFLDTIREGHPTTPLLVATPIICPVAENHPGPTLLREDGQVHIVARDPELATGALTLVRVREIVTEIVRTRQEDGDDALFLLDGLSLFGPDDIDDLPDGLHPNSTGYRRMGARFFDAVFTGDGAFAAND